MINEIYIYKQKAIDMQLNIYVFAGYYFLNFNSGHSAYETAGLLLNFMFIKKIFCIDNGRKVLNIEISV